MSLRSQPIVERLDLLSKRGDLLVLPSKAVNCLRRYELGVYFSLSVLNLVRLETRVHRFQGALKIDDFFILTA